MRMYLDREGRLLFVSSGISNGTVWMTCYRTNTGSLKRLVSPRLPLRSTREEAQQDLDAYARAKRFKLAYLPDRAKGVQTA